MRFLMVVLTSILLSGCTASRDSVVVGGVEDYIQIPKSSKIENVPLPTDENKTYTVVTQKNGVWLSLEAWNRIEKGN